MVFRKSSAEPNASLSSSTGPPKRLEPMTETSERTAVSSARSVNWATTTQPPRAAFAALTATRPEPTPAVAFLFET